MIEQKTVFILGAGSSVPYGYPTGKELRHKIIYSSKGLLDNLILKDTTVPNEVLTIYNTQIKAFLNDFKRSATPSIDLFLSRNSQYETIGKLSIAISILYAETKSKFVENIDQNYKDWYTFLMGRMTEKLPKPDDYVKFASNNVSFITFNYDRSLDFFINDSLMHSFTGIDPKKIDQSELIPFPIIHVYGSLAKLPWQEIGSPDYRIGKLNDSMKDFNLIHSMSKNIRIIQERTNDEIEKAKDLILNAERIFFLGFGYADENLEVLGIPDMLKPSQRIFGTVLGYKHEEIMRIFQKLPKPNARRYNIEDPYYRYGRITLAKVDSLDLLREYL